MKLADSIRGLNIRQRAVIWVGGVALLLAAFYPKMQTGYYGWATWSDDNYTNAKWLLLYQTDKRMFIADAEFGGMPASVKALGRASYPEVDHILRRMSLFDGMCIDRRESIKVWNLLLEILAVVIVTMGLAWVLQSSPPSQEAQGKSD